MRVKMSTMMVLLAAQPALATQLVQIAPVTAACPAGAATCPPVDVPAQAADGIAAAGPLVAGLAGLLVLGLVFGRRRPGLPEVVS